MMIRTLRTFSLILLLVPLGLRAQVSLVNLSGTVKSEKNQELLPFVNIQLLSPADSSFLSGTITDEQGLFNLSDIAPGKYLLSLSFIGFKGLYKDLYIGSNSAYLDLGVLYLKEDNEQLEEVVVSARKEALSAKMDKKTYLPEDNLSQSGGSVLQTLSQLPGISTQEGEIQLRGSNQVMILIDGKQTAITGFGKQNGLDNIPASAIEKIEIINNPSAQYDANGNAGIINIILKKQDASGLNGQAGLSTGLGALWVRKDNLPGIRPQYQATPKINPSIALNYRKNKMNLFLQADHLYIESLNRNEFVSRSYADGTQIDQQLKRNRNTHFFTSKAGLDYQLDANNSISLATYFSRESVKDYGDQPFFNGRTGESLRLWQFLEDEVLTAYMGSLDYEHKFPEPGHLLKLGYRYSFDREDESYFFDNKLPSYQSKESFHLIADQKVSDFNLDYQRPLKHGLLETGLKFRQRIIPTIMQFNPSVQHSVLDVGADGIATYRETIPAIYGNLNYEIQDWEAELGLRLEYVDLYYEVSPGHNTYKSDGYQYLQPFPNARIAYKISDGDKLSLFFNRRVDRPDEVDIRIFPKYDDAEIIKVGNPALKPQFTNSLELGYKHAWEKGSIYGAAYHRMSKAQISRIAIQSDTSNLIYNISQNTGAAFNSGIELDLNQKLSKWLRLNANLNVYYNQISAFTVLNRYPKLSYYSAPAQDLLSGNFKLNFNFKLGQSTHMQISSIYLAPDIIPQGKIDARYSLNFGLSRRLQNGKGEFFINATDLLNSMVIRQEINADGFKYSSANYYETQVIRIGYKYKF